MRDILLIIIIGLLYLLITIQATFWTAFLQTQGCTVEYVKENGIKITCPVPKF
jgi:hypothetical protein